MRPFRALTAIIKRRRAEKDLRASEEYTRSLIESSLDTIISVDLERHIVAFNKAAQETFGYRAEEILGKHIDVLYADPQDGLQVHQTTIGAGTVVREAPGLRKDGQVFPSLFPPLPCTIPRGELMVGVMGVIPRYHRAQAGGGATPAPSGRDGPPESNHHAHCFGLGHSRGLTEACAEMARFLQIPQAYLALLNPQRTAAEVVADCHPQAAPLLWESSFPWRVTPSLAYILEHKVPLTVTQAQTDPLLAAVQYQCAGRALGACSWCVFWSRKR